MSSRCSLKLFGGLDLVGPSGPLDGRVSQHRQLAVLALLASSPAGLSRDKLLGYLWPEMEGERGRRLLSDTLYVIRNELGNEAVAASSDCLRLNSDFVWTDLSAFSEALAHGELERALELYRGPFLDGFYLSGSREFEGWVDGERAQRAKEAMAAARQLSAREEESGNMVGAAGWARRATNIDPFDEEGIRCLIRLLDEAGDRAGAVREFEGFSRSLAEEFELEPSPETRELIEAIRERQASRQAPAKSAGAAASETPDKAAPLADSPVVAVLPFADMSPEKDQEYFSDGITDDIITQLSKIAGLKVISRQSSMQYKGSDKGLKEIADELDVTAILEGGVQRVGDEIRINVQLVDAATDVHIWAEQYDRDLTDVFAIQSDVAGRIAAALEATLTPAEKEQIEQRPTENLDAYEYYLRGKAFANRRDYEAAVEMYALAVELDPDFAVAWAEMAVRRTGTFFVNLRLEERLKAEEAIDRAIDLAPNGFETHMAQGNYCRLVKGDYSTALEHYAAAEKLRPNDADVLRSIGRNLRFQGQWEQGLAYQERALEFNPRNLPLTRSTANTLKRMRRFAEAERYYDRAIALDPSNEVHYNLEFDLYLRGLGDTLKARAFAEQYRDSVGPEMSSKWQWELSYFRRDYERALDLLLSEPEPNHYWIAVIYHITQRPEPCQMHADSLRSRLESQVDCVSGDGYLPLHIAWRRSQLGLAYALMDKEEAAIREGQQGVELFPVSADAWNGPIMVDNLAHIYLFLGRHDAAIDQLELLLSIPTVFTTGRLRIEPRYDPLRDHPRFQALLEKYEQPQQ